MSRKTKAIRQFLLLSQPKQQHKQPLQSPPPQQQSWQQPWQQSWQVQNGMPWQVQHGMPQQLQSELGCIVDPTATAAPTPTTATAAPTPTATPMATLSRFICIAGIAVGTASGIWNWMGDPG
mmetsp:Transcript_84146/g.163509  ORF Transcript_84146/g.163509 Transcript_84146/m.163509 type:complete len:122 (-) Transcript_84146:296-661(-)